MLKKFSVILSVAHKRKAFHAVRSMKRGDVIYPTDIRETITYFDKDMVDKQAVDTLEESIGKDE